MKLLQHIKERYMTECEKDRSRELEYLTYVSEKNNLELRLLKNMMSKICEILPIDGKNYNEKILTGGYHEIH